MDSYVEYSVEISNLMELILEDGDLSDDQKCQLFIEANELASEYLDMLED